MRPETVRGPGDDGRTQRKGVAEDGAWVLEGCGGAWVVEGSTGAWVVQGCRGEWWWRTVGGGAWEDTSK